MSNAYLILEEEPILVDTCMPGDEKFVLSYLSKLGLKPDDISTIVLTHFHIDHTGGLSEILNHTNAKTPNVLVHQEDADFVTGKKEFPFLVRVAAKPFGFKPVKAQKIADGDKIGNFTVMHTPGHTPGSISIHNPDEKIIFVGDCLRSPNSEIKGPSRLFTMDMRQAKKSLNKISQLDFDVMLAGHGDPIISKGSEIVKNFTRNQAEK